MRLAVTKLAGIETARSTIRLDQMLFGFTYSVHWSAARKELLLDHFGLLATAADLPVFPQDALRALTALAPISSRHEIFCVAIFSGDTTFLPGVASTGKRLGARMNKDG